MVTRLVYLDSSAAAKLFKDEAESAALEDWLVQQAPAQQITSHLTRTELRRALHAVEVGTDAMGRAEQWLDRCAHVQLSGALFDKAGRLAPGSRVRSLDALHVVAAQGLGPAVTAFVTYDKRLAETASAHDLPVVAPN